MPTPQTQTSTAAPPPRRIMGRPQTFKRRDYVALDYHWTIEKGHTVDDLKNPDYWGHIAGKLRPYDHIWFASEDGSLYGLARVIAVASTWAKVQIVFEAHSDPMEVDPTPERGLYKVDHIGTGWRVIHRDTGKVVKGELTRREDAEAAIDEIVAKKTKQ